VATFGPTTRLQRWYDRLTLLRAVTSIIAVALMLVLLAGLIARLVEPEINQ